MGIELFLPGGTNDTKAIRGIQGLFVKSKKRFIVARITLKEQLTDLATDFSHLTQESRSANKT